ncbi:hypothetical protein HYE69_02445 [Staphylococcus sp. GSSP0090]|nr:hypothetical protein [Staphylococcus sp. GSSP0090]
MKLINRKIKASGAGKLRVVKNNLFSKSVEVEAEINLETGNVNLYIANENLEKLISEYQTESKK